jgi:hypothetical protein
MTRDTPTSTSNATADPQQLRIAQLEQEVINERLSGLSQLIRNEQVHEEQIKKIAKAPQRKPVGFTADEYGAALWTANLQLRDEHLNSCPQKNAELAQPPRKKVKRGKKAPLQLVEYDDGVFRDRKGHMVNIGRGFQYVHRKYRFLLTRPRCRSISTLVQLSPFLTPVPPTKSSRLLWALYLTCAHPGFKGRTVCLLSELGVRLASKPFPR